MPDGASGGEGDVSLPRETTRQMVAKTQFAITGEDTRYFLNGALLVLKPKEMSMVATDGHRLALVTAPREAAPGAPDELRVIVQKKTLLELGRLLGESGDVVTFEKGENHLFFRFADRVLVSRMIDGQFPGLRAGHPERQRQGGRVRSRSPDQRREARGPAGQRAFAVGKIPDRSGRSDGHVEQLGVR